MRKATRFRTLSLVICTALGAPAIAVDVTTRVDAVTVYTDGALVTRVGNVRLPAGAEEIVIDDLGVYVDPYSLRVSVDDPSVRVGAIDVETVEIERSENPEVIRLTEALTALRNEVRAIDDVIAAANLRMELLKSVVKGYGEEGDRVGAGVQSWRAAVGVIDDEALAALRTIREREAEKRPLLRRIDALQRELEDVDDEVLERSRIRIGVSSPGATETRVSLQYTQDEARWYPVYEARLDSDSGALELVQQAEVSQETSEDWSRVALTLSTSAPAEELAVDIPDSQYLDLADPRQQGGISSMAADSVELEEIIVTGSRVRGGLPSSAQADIDAGRFAATYAIPGRSSVGNAADKRSTFDLARFDFDTTLVTRVVPRADDSAYLTARFRYAGDLPLLAGALRIYVDGAFAGIDDIDTLSPREDVTLPMGRDPGVAVVVTEQGGDSGERGVLSRKQRETTDVVFKLTSRRSSPTEVEVLDTIPVADNRSIDVEVADDATPPTERDVDDRKGVVAWRDTLAPGQSWEIRHHFTVTYPADKVLQRRRR